LAVVAAAVAVEALVAQQRGVVAAVAARWRP
jgi:hypothetical protein